MAILSGFDWQKSFAGGKHSDLASAWFDWALDRKTREPGPKYTAYQAPAVKGAKASK